MISQNLVIFTGIIWGCVLAAGAMAQSAPVRYPPVLPTIRDKMPAGATLSGDSLRTVEGRSIEDYRNYILSPENNTIKSGTILRIKRGDPGTSNLPNPVTQPIAPKAGDSGDSNFKVPINF